MNQYSRFREYTIYCGVGSIIIESADKVKWIKSDVEAHTETSRRDSSTDK